MTDPVKTKRGRPRLPVPGARVTTWLRSTDYDRLLKAAKAQDVTISGLVRTLLKGHLHTT